MGLLDNTPQAENFEEKCLCVLALDVSGSMDGKPMFELNKGLQQFAADVYNDPALCARLEVGIVTFESHVKVVQEPALVDTFDMPKLSADGLTNMVAGIRAAMKMVRDRKDYWQAKGITYRRPWIVVITDGEPDDGQDIKSLHQEIEQHKAVDAFMFLPIGIEGANMKKLAELSEDTPKKLDGLNFAKLFVWLSNSFSKISTAKKGEKVKFNKPDWIEEEYIA